MMDFISNYHKLYSAAKHHLKKIEEAALNYNTEYFKSWDKSVEILKPFFRIEKATDDTLSFYAGSKLVLLKAEFSPNEKLKSSEYLIRIYFLEDDLDNFGHLQMVFKGEITSKTCTEIIHVGKNEVFATSIAVGKDFINLLMPEIKPVPITHLLSKRK